MGRPLFLGHTPMDHLLSHHMQFYDAEQRLPTPLERTSAGLEWVHVVRPGGATDAIARRQVRSHVTKVQHRRARETGRNTLRPGLGFTGSGRHAAIASRTVSRTTTPIPPSSRNTLEADEEIQQRDAIMLKDHAEDATEDSPSTPLIPTTAWMKAFSRGEMSFKTFALQDSEDTVGSSLEALQLDLSSVMSFYRMICSCQSKDFHSQYGLNTRGRSSVPRFYEFVHEDPALLSMAVLLGVRNRLEVSNQRIEGRDLAVVINLERHVINSINMALNDRLRGVSDQLLCVVGLCAAYEIKHGDPTRYHVHMQGLLRMIELRGGLSAIGCLNSYTVRFLLWLDVNMAELHGSKGYLRAMSDESGILLPESNTPAFTTKLEGEARGVMQKV